MLFWPWKRRAGAGFVCFLIFIHASIATADRMRDGKTVAVDRSADIGRSSSNIGHERTEDCRSGDMKCPQRYGTGNRGISDEHHGYIKSSRAVLEYPGGRHSLHGKVTVNEFSAMAVVINAKYNEYGYASNHEYASYEDLRLAAGPQVNHDTCIRHLTHIGERLANLSVERQYSRDVNVAELMDTFGHSPSGQFLGNYIWTGSYRACLRHRLISPEGPLRSRYCVAKVRDVAWRDEVAPEKFGIHVGVCLPESCDSERYRNKYELVDHLMQFNARQNERGQYRLKDLYCLPDEDSPLRSVWREQKTVIALAVAACWFGLILYATAKDYFHSRKLAQLSDGDELGIWRSLSIITNVYKLCGVSRYDAPARVEERKFLRLEIIESIKGLSLCYILLGHTSMITCGGLIDVRHLMLNSAHLLSYLTPAFAVNCFFAITGILTAYLLLKQNKSRPFFNSPSKWLVIILYRYVRLMPMYLLTVLYGKTLAKYASSGPFWDYATSSQSHRRTCEQESILWTLLLGANFRKPFDHCNPSAWYLANDFQFFLVTPFFLILLDRWPKLAKRVIFACMTMSFAACFSGIVFNYEFEDLRAIANYDPPAFKINVSVLYRTYTRPYYRIYAYLIGVFTGYLLYEHEQAAINASTESGKASNGEATDTQKKKVSKSRSGRREWPGLVKFLAKSSCLIVALPFAFIACTRLHMSPMSTTIFVTTLLPFYGLLHLLALDLIYSYRQRVISHSDGPQQPKLVRRYGLMISVALLVIVCCAPYVGASKTYNTSMKLFARFLVAMGFATSNLTFAIIAGLIILSKATAGDTGREGLLSRILTAPQWKVLSRLSLCVLLLNVEIITYIADGREYLHPITSRYSWGTNLMSLVLVHIVCALAHVLIESPLQALIGNKLLALLMKGQRDEKRAAAAGETRPKNGNELKTIKD